MEGLTKVYAASRLLALRTFEGPNYDHDAVIKEWLRVQAKGELRIVETDRPNIWLTVASFNYSFYIFIHDDLLDAYPQDSLVGLVTFNSIGATQFNGKTMELKSALGNKLYTPHAEINPDHQKQKIVSSIYSWFLEAGNCLMTGDSHSRAANLLWRNLASVFPTYLIDLMGLEILSPKTRERIAKSHLIRLLMLGTSFSFEDLKDLGSSVSAKLVDEPGFGTTTEDLNSEPDLFGDHPTRTGMGVNNIMLPSTPVQG